MIRKLLRPIIIVLLSFIPISAFALGMGQITVYSALNQVLNAEIELLAVAPGDLDNLSIQVSTQAFIPSGFGSSSQGTSANFSAAVNTRDGRSFVKLTSSIPMREPLLNLLIELDWANGRLVREFAVLLDPPDLAPTPPPTPAVTSAPRPESRPSTPPQAAAPAPQASPAEPPAAEAEPVSEPSAVPPERAYRGGDVYGPVARGDTLWRIADRIRPENVSIQQMMLALRDKNPRAFLRGNIDGLLAGVSLDIPTAEEIASYTPLTAQDLVRQQVNRSQDASPSTVSQEPSPAPAAAQPGRVVLEQPNQQPAAGETAGTAAAAPALDSRFKIKLAGNNLQLTIAQINQLRDRIDRLVAAGDLGAVSPASAAPVLESSETQASLPTPQPAVDEAPQSEVSPAPAAEVIAETPEQPVADETPPSETFEPTPAVEVIAEAPEQPVADETPPSETIEPAPAAEVIAETPPAENATPGTVLEDTAPPLSDAQSEPQTGETATAQVQPPEPAIPQTQTLDETPRLTFMEQFFILLRDPAMLGLLGAGLLLLIALPILLLRVLRRRRAEEEAAEDEDYQPVLRPDEPEVSTAAGAGAAGTLAAVASPEQTVSLGKSASSEPERDLLEQADNLLARGNYSGAEGVVSQALAKDPGNTDLLVKMLDIRFAAGNTEGFLEDAKVLRNQLGSESDPVWKRVAYMGRQLLPANPLFGGAPEPPTAKVPDIVEQKKPLSEPEPDVSASDEMFAESDDDTAMEFDFDALAGLDEQDKETVSEDASSDPFEGLDWQLPETDSDTAEGDELELSEQQSDSTDSDDFDAQLQGLSFEFDDLDAPEDQESSKPAIDKPAAVTKEEDSEMESMAFDSADFFDADSSVESSSMPDDDLSAELESLDFDAPAAGQEDDKLGAEDSQPLAAGDVENDGDFFAFEDYVETKLDLATAYLDMEDPIGARSLLEEVLKEGNPDQRQRAEELMQRLT